MAVCLVSWFMVVILAPRGLRQEYQEIKASLGYTVISGSAWAT